MAIALTCSECEHVLKIKDELAGRKIKCPACGGVIAVPAGSKTTSAVAAGAPAKTSPTLENDEDRPRKKKKKKKTNKGLLVALGVAGLLLVAGGVVLIIVLTRPDGERDRTQAKADKKGQEIVPGADARAANDKPDPLQIKPNPPPKGLVQNIRAAAYRPERQNELRQIGLFFQTFEIDQRRVPRTEKEFIDYIKRDASGIAKAVEEKYYILNLKVNMRAANDIIAYESLTDAGGHQCVRVDGSVAPVPVEELRKLLTP